MERYKLYDSYEASFMETCDDGDYVLHYEAHAEIARLTKERDEWKEAATRLHPNPADYRYWEGRYRDEKARTDTAWNDAIEAAAQVANDYDHYELESAIRALRREKVE